MSPRTRKVVRWSSRIFLGLIGLLVLAIAGVLVFLHTDRGRAFVRTQVAAKLNDTFVGGATVGSIEGSPFGELVLTDLVINDPEGQPAVKVKRLGIEIALLPLIRQEARLKSVIASDIDVNLRRDQNGELMVGRMVKQKDEESGWSVDLSHLELHRGHVQVAMPDGPMNIDGIEVFGAATLPATGAIATSVGLRAVWREKRAPILVDAIARVNEGVVSVHTLNAMVGGVRVTADAVRFAPGEGDQPPHLDGSLTIDAPKREVAKLAPEVQLPDDVSASIVVRDGSPFAHVRVVGRLGKTHAQLLAGADLARKRAVGVVTTNAVDLPLLTNGKTTGTGGAMISFGAALGRENEKPVASGVATVWGQVNDLPHLASAITFSTDFERAMTRVGVSGPALLATIAADVTKIGEAITLDRSTVIASTSSPSAASGGKAPVRGAIDVRLSANGQLAPAPNLAVTGTVKGRRLRMQDMSVSSLDVAVQASGLPRAPRGKAEVLVEDLVRGDMELGQVKVTAANQADGTIAVAVRSRPKFAEWMIDVDALVTPPRKPRRDTWLVDIAKHRVRAADKGEWTGTTGHLEIGPDHYAIENFSSTSSEGQFTLSASIAPRELDLALFVQRSGMGVARLALDVEAPAELTNPVAWKRLPRTAIRSGKFELQGVDLAKIAELLDRPGEMRGRVEGSITLTPTATTGRIDIANIMTAATAKLGRLDAGLTITSRGNEITPTLIGNFAALGRFQATATVELPQRPFDPIAWQAVGLPALRGANLAVDEIAIEPGLLDRFGVTTELRGRVKLAAAVSEGARSANVSLDVAQLRGDMIARPINASVTATLDERAGRANVLVTSGPTTLLDVKGELPVTIDQLFANPKLLMTTPFKASGTIPNAPARTLLSVFGRAEVIGGTLGGTIDAKGTLAAPSVVAKIVGTKLQVPPGPRNRPVKVLDNVTIDASFIGGVAKARIQGTQQGGYLDMFATADPTNLAAGRVTIKAKAFDLQPLLVFAPGPAGAARGRLDADLTVQGLDPVKAQIAGKLRMTNARIPIAPQVGTLRRANIDVVIGQSNMTVNVDGRLGPGTVKVASKFALSGAQPTSGDATITLRKVTPIGTVEPRIDADVTAKLVREDDRWVANLVVSNGVVKVPDNRDGEKLKPVGAPPDMIFATGERVTSRPMEKAPPKKAVIVANITLKPTYVESKELRGVIRGKVSISADAEAIGITGTIEADRGDLDLFGRRYQVERAAVVFDGTIDPLLDLRIAHDFPDVTTVTQVRGRLSKPELVMSSDPPIYSQSQLLGFLLGGEPNGDPQQGSAREVATNAGASFIANKLGGYVKKALPVDIDVVRYEAASASESAAVTVGTWITRSLFVAYRRRLEARPDENANEAEAEYWLSRRVLVEGTTGDRGVSGLDLLWRRRY